MRTSPVTHRAINSESWYARDAMCLVLSPTTTSP